ncbi:alpha/beta fold hydrolase [Nocardioides sp. URHA0032]|uniref:alpha/beta fold hydrolase n=1 Tax=Nocardioides sp. URHA0032 TaxID=1380388 RepID=UPI00048D02F8|nr:alpha/beta hydrolase [Nocardioides sp. URHA0032]
MRTRTHLIGATATALGLAAAGAGVAAQQRRRIARRSPGERPAFGSLRADPVTVVAEDGTPLHVEVDEADSAVTLVFCHGYSLNLDCWHFQREHYRGRIRSVYYDQRSHGRSGRSPIGHATIDQLGQDLVRILEEVVPDGPVVLVGHSMGGMTIVALAQQHPELFGDRIVGTSLISTTAGGLDPSRILFPMMPTWAGSGAMHRGVATLARGHRAVDGLRRLGRNVALVATDQLAFGDHVPASYVEFVDSMLAATPFEVVAEFFPGFGQLDKFDHVGVLANVPTTIICGTEDKLTSIGHSRKLHGRIDGSTLLECHGAGHMVILERYDEVDGELDKLLAAAGVGA